MTIESLGSYKILEELGRGGMGTVYRGADTRTGEPVAIKSLHSDLADTAMLERFKREGEALRRLNHPNIVKMLDAVEENGQHYLIMEFVPGGSLQELMASTHQLPIKDVLQIALELSDALTRTHHLNIIHRDIKPANVLLAADGTPRLSDFGIVRTADVNLTEGGAIFGTVAYLCPEILQENEVTPRADIWAFGVLLFEMLAGERPYQGD